jgi:acyl-CoA reductase-like NAD-dependent aldehyde dehydrogenase
LYIGGEWTVGTGPELAIENPATEATIEVVRTASFGQVDEAVRAANAAFASWRKLSTGDRAHALQVAANRLEEHAEEIARILTIEGGKPLLENRDEIGWCVACLRFYSELARTSEGTVIPPIEPTQLALVLKEPIGVVGAIVPWNYPLLLLFWKLAPALAAGNVVIVKPSELTPLSTVRTFELALAHLPSGVVQLVLGAGDVGRSLVEHSDVHCIAFTGSTTTGQWIARTAADTMKRVNLELGGKDAFIVCDDVVDDVLDTAARGGVWAAYLNAGQVCTSAERFYVHEAVYDDYVDRFVHHANAIRIGDPLADGVDLGPMVSEAQRSRTERHVADARERGATLLAGGERHGDRGWFYRPTVLVDVRDDALVLDEETFGPVAPIVPVRSVDEAIARANASRYGLGANVYTRRLDYAMQCLRELRAGTVWINDPLTDNDAGPFGGFKMSGLGRELGTEGLEAFRETKHVHLDWEAQPKDWWYPY